MKTLTLQIIREKYTSRTSIGKMYIKYDSIREYFGYTLEDTARPGNIKVYSETCIPPVICNVRLYESERFGKTILFYTENDLVTLKVGKLKWEYILAHGGNDHEDTAGCVLVARNRISDEMIQGSLQKELYTFLEKKFKEGYILYAEFINSDQYN